MAGWWEHHIEALRMSISLVTVCSRIAELEMHLLAAKISQRFRMEYHYEPLDLYQKLTARPEKPGPTSKFIIYLIFGQSRVETGALSLVTFRHLFHEFTQETDDKDIRRKEKDVYNSAKYRSKIGNKASIVLQEICQ
ncbi:hypothetical protein P5673_003954, partial [Acropora cervicornis]